MTTTNTKRTLDAAARRALAENAAVLRSSEGGGK